MALVCLLAALATCVSCKGEEIPNTRSITEQLSALPNVFMSESGKQIEEPSLGEARGIIRNGEVYWPAMTCTNPDCPEANESDEPYLFVIPDPRVEVVDGEFIDRKFGSPQEYEAYLAEEGIIFPPVCPACREAFDLENASPQELAEHQSHVVVYELPDTAAERKRLNQQLHELQESYRRRTGG